MVSVCNIFMNVVVLDRVFVEKQPVFFHLLKTIMDILPDVRNHGDELVLYGNLSVLGLLILKHHPRRPKSTDFAIYKFAQAIIR